jgi:hypothetical protein
LVSADVTAAQETIDISASLAHGDLVDVHVGLDFGHDICHA